jgi:diaminopimelate decarboxylase/aspartate kinase
VVHSALPGVTDRLSALLAFDDAGRADALEGIATQTLALAEELDVAAEARPELDACLDALSAAVARAPRTPFAAQEADLDGWRRQAEVVAFGERLVSPIGAAFLRRHGLDLAVVPAPELLRAELPPGEGEGYGGGPRGARIWLSAECGAEPDPEVVARVRGAGGRVVLTQGFTARHAEEDAPVLLGRGGSDTAAAYLAGKLDAVRLEVWSDVPGMFTADPRAVADARLIRELDFAEAQEIATTGSRVLHPRCIPALRSRGVPIHLRSVADPEGPGTRIVPQLPESRPGLRAVSRKDRVLVLSVETIGMWQEVGFLARVFGVIAEEGLSVDLVSTSETNVTLSLDGDANMVDPAVLARVVGRLAGIAAVRVIDRATAVSLVGRNVRRQLHRLGPILESFEEHRIHLVSQAANDLNFTVVVDELDAGRLVEQMHAVLVGGVGDAREDEAAAPDASVPDRGRGRWWRDRVPELVEIAAAGPAYVYDLATVRARTRAVRSIPGVDRVLYAMKANWNPEILRASRAEGAGFECVSPGELAHLARTFPDLGADEIVFTPNFAPREEYAQALDAGYLVTLDALHPVTRWPELFGGREVVLRLDLGWGRGHHEKVITGGRHSKFGIPLFELERVASALEDVGARVVGLHSHAGSDIHEGEHWRRVGERLASLRERFAEVRFLNLGGGLGVPSVVGGPALSLERLAAGLATVRAAHPDVEVWLEPGRYLVAEAGVLLGRVTQTKGKEGVRYVGLDVGMNSLLRPALYGAHHDIVNLSRLDAPDTGRAQIVGPICESGDRLGIDRAFPDTEEGDVVLIDVAGAYGRVMASRYNLREPAREVVLAD